MAEYDQTDMAMMDEPNALECRVTIGGKTDVYTVEYRGHGERAREAAMLALRMMAADKLYPEAGQLIRDLMLAGAMPPDGIP